MMKKAVFLDRDGVLNELIFNSVTNAYESPHFVEDFFVKPEVTTDLLRLKQQKYLLFLVSNQPSYAKGKTSLENIKEIHNILERILRNSGVEFQESYYCYHHPEGIVPEYTVRCECRKPGTYFLKEACKKYVLDMKNSWFIGDQDSDIFCGNAAGTRTILINEPNSVLKRGLSQPDYMVTNLKEAVNLILRENKSNGG